MMVIRFLCILLVAGLAADAAESFYHPLKMTPQELVGGADNLRLIRDATSVTVYRITGVNSGKTGVSYWKWAPAAVMISGPEVRQAAAALVEVKNHRTMSMCDFDPPVLVRFTDAEKTQTLDLVVCFRCHEMLMYRDGKIVERPAKWADKKSSFGREIHNALGRIARKAFPKDPVIQKIEVDGLK